MASIELPGEFGVNHRAASENLIRATLLTTNDLPTIERLLDNAALFEKAAQTHVVTPRQEALAMGLLHAVDLIRAVAHAEFGMGVYSR